MSLGRFLYLSVLQFLQQPALFVLSLLPDCELRTVTSLCSFLPSGSIWLSLRCLSDHFKLGALGRKCHWHSGEGERGASVIVAVVLGRFGEERLFQLKWHNHTFQRSWQLQGLKWYHQDSVSFFSLWAQFVPGQAPSSWKLPLQTRWSLQATPAERVSFLNNFKESLGIEPFMGSDWFTSHVRVFSYWSGQGHMLSQDAEWGWSLFHLLHMDWGWGKVMPQGNRSVGTRSRQKHLLILRASSPAPWAFWLCSQLHPPYQESWLWAGTRSHSMSLLYFLCLHLITELSKSQGWSKEPMTPHIEHPSLTWILWPTFITLFQ